MNTFTTTVIGIIVLIASVLILCAIFFALGRMIDFIAEKFKCNNVLLKQMMCAYVMLFIIVSFFGYAIGMLVTTIF